MNKEGCLCGNAEPRLVGTTQGLIAGLPFLTFIFCLLL